MAFVVLSFDACVARRPVTQNTLSMYQKQSLVDNESMVAQSVESWTCDWKLAGSNLGWKDPCHCGTISVVSALCHSED